MAKKKTTEKALNIDNILFNCRDYLRAARNSGSFFEKRDMMLTLVFLRFIGEKYEDGIKNLKQTLKEQGLDPEDENIRAAFFDDATFADGTYNLPPEARWSTIISTPAPQLNVALDTALQRLEEEDPQLKGCFVKGTFTARNLAANDIKKIVDEVNKISHKTFGEEKDLIGRVYEYFLKEFAVNATKEEGEFYTPHDVVQLIATMIEPYDGTLYDPCCGSGGMFIQSAELVKSKQGNLNGINVYGQEKEPATYRLAKMNLALRGISHNLGEEADSSFTHTSVAPTADDVEQATSVFREELEVLKNMFTGYDLSPFLNPECDPIERYRLLAKAAEYVFVSTEELQSEGNKGVQKVSFKTYYLKTVKRMRAAFDICQPSGYLGEEESALAQCFMAIAGFVRKMSGTSEVDADTMNRAVSKMVEEALKYNQVESVLESGEEEDIFSPEYFEKLSDVKMPATKLELLVKMLRKQIKEYGKVNQLAAKSYQEMLEKTIAEYHERRKHLTAEEAGEAQEQASEDVIKIATEQALAILRQMNENRESFRKIGLTFEEKAFYDILISLRDQYNFEYGTDKEVDGVIVNDKCKALAKKIKDIIDTKSSFADWLNNQNVRNGLKLEIKICLVKNGYPPQYSPEVFNKVMEQVENFEEYSGTEGIGNEASTSGKIYEYKPEYKVMMVAEDSSKYGDSKNNQ